jgi:hypothetical protein
MRRFVLAGLLALPPLLASAGSAAAQCGPGGCGLIQPPGCGSGFGSYYGHHLPCPNFGCGGFCVNLFSRIHQHGPLFNYGPYYGYYPFEPYGPWTSDLRYNPPCTGKHCGLGRGLGDGDGLGKHGWAKYACDTFKNVVHRLHGHKKHGCVTGECASGGTCAGCTASLTAPPAPLATAAQPYPEAGAAVLLTGYGK